MQRLLLAIHVPLHACRAGGQGARRPVLGGPTGRSGADPGQPGPPLTPRRRWAVRVAGRQSTSTFASRPPLLPADFRHNTAEPPLSPYVTSLARHRRRLAGAPERTGYASARP